MSKKMQYNILLFLTAMIWGSGFVAQKAGATLEPFTYNGIRMFIGGLALLPLAFWSSKQTAGSELLSEGASRHFNASNLVGGICCGIVLCIASNLQQFGLYFETDAGKAGFITSLYIVFVPLLGIFLKKKVRPVVWVCVLLAAFGFYLLTMSQSASGLSLQKGDFFILLCSFAFACHIMVIDHFSPKCDGIKLSCIQFLTTGVTSMLLMLIFENPSISSILECRNSILYSGIVSAGLGYTLQIMGQKHAEPTVATLLMSLEAVFAVIFGILLMGERITKTEGVGCAIIFIAVLIPQLLDKPKETSQASS
ncbi:MAG: DMT family transporter [Clostridiales bacterium]|nr:DMT family transporter [Clostridiales bacterium]